MIEVREWFLTILLGYSVFGFIWTNILLYKFGKWMGFNICEFLLKKGLIKINGK